MRRFAFILVAFILIGATPSWAGRIMTDGFELNNVNLLWDTGSGSIVTTAPHGGTYHLSLSGGSQVRRILTSNITAGTFFTRMYVRFVDSTPTSDALFYQFQNAANTFSGGLTETTAGKIRLTNVVTATAVETTTVLNSATYYRVEFRHYLSDTAGQIEGRLYLGDSMTPLETWGIGTCTGCNGTNEDTLNTQVRNIGWVYSGSSSVYIDDIAVNYCSTAVPTGSDCLGYQESWPGPAKLNLVKPASDQTVNWTKNGACAAPTTSADCIDEYPGPTDDSDYTSTTTVQADRFNGTTLAAAGVPSDADMLLVWVYARFGGTSTTGNYTSRPLLWDQSGTVANGPTQGGCDTATWTAYTVSTGSGVALVFDPGTRTRDQVDTFDYGYEALSIDAAGSCRVSSIAVFVEWIESTGPPPGTGLRLLIGVGL